MVLVAGPVVPPAPGAWKGCERDVKGSMESWAGKRRELVDCVGSSSETGRGGDSGTWGGKEKGH